MDGVFEVSGAPVKMFNPLRTQTRVAVTSTTAKGTRACLFTNFNGKQNASNVEPNGYDIVRAAKPEYDVTISDA